MTPTLNTISLERLKPRRQRWTARMGQRLVRIWSGQWGSYWAPERNGYTRRIEEAGVYTLADALDASGHCGPEKRICYEFLPAGSGAPTQEARGAAALLLDVRAD